MKRFISILLAVAVFLSSFSINLQAKAVAAGLISYKFDLGGEGTAAGYIGVSASDKYTDELGYGFGDPAAVMNVKASGKGAMADAVRFLDADNKKRVFRVKLPQGLYKVTVTTGDVNSAIITAEGRSQLFFLTGNNASDSFTIPVTDGTLDIVLSSGVGGVYSLSAVEVEQISTSPTTRPTIWLYGDSTVCNYYNISDTHAHGWGQYLKNYINTGAYDVRNMAINGMKATSLYEYGNTKAPHDSYDVAMAYGKSGDILVLAFGMSDYTDTSVSAAAYKRAITGLTKLAQSKGMKVYLVKPQGEMDDIGKYPVMDKKWYSDEVDQVAAATGAKVINLFKPWLEFGLIKTNDIFSQYYSVSESGGINIRHTNKKGAMILANMVADALFPPKTSASSDTSKKYDSEFSGSSTITYKVEEDGTGPIKNPHKGYVMDVSYPYQFEASYPNGIGGSNNNHAWDVVSIIYGVNFWKDLNPSKGVYNWKPIDDMLEACAARGMTYGIRILPYSTGAGSDANYGASHNFVPKWVFDSGAVMDRVTYKYGHGNTQIDVPQWKHPKYIEAYKEFVRALAKKYDGDPRVEFVEIRPFGNFGEWHTSQFVGNDMPSIAQQKDMLKFFADNFKHTSLQALSDVKGEVYDYALSLGITKRNDGLIMTPNEEWDLIPAYEANLPVAGDYHHQYKYMRYTLTANNPEHFLLWTPQRFVETIEIPHLTMLSIDMDSTFGYQIYKEEKALIDKMSHRLGYNFVVTSVKRNGNNLLVKIKNNGLAPAFFDIDLTAEIIDANGNKISSIGAPVSIKSGTFHDGETKAFVFKYSGTFPAGTTIGLAMYESGKKTSNPTVRFDNKNSLSNNRLKLVDPNSAPTKAPTTAPTKAPTSSVTVGPTPMAVSPTIEPTSGASAGPTGEAGNMTVTPTDNIVSPTSVPLAKPTGEVTTEPTGEVTIEPTAEPTGEVTSEPTAGPTSEAITEATLTPTAEVSDQASSSESAEPTGEPTKVPAASASSLKSIAAILGLVIALGVIFILVFFKKKKKE